MELKLSKKDVVGIIASVFALSFPFIRFNVEKIESVKVKVENKSWFSWEKDSFSTDITDLTSVKKSHHYNMYPFWEGYGKLEEGKTGTLDATSYNNLLGWKHLSVQRFKPDAEQIQTAAKSK